MTSFSLTERKILLFFFLFAGFFLLSQTAFAADQCVVDPLPGLLTGGYWATNPPLLPCIGVACKACGICGLFVLAQRILYFVVTVIFYVIVPLRLVWGGYYILFAGGSSSLLSQGKSIFLQTLVGLVLTLGAFVILQTFLWFLGSPSEVPWGVIQCTAPF